MIQIGEEAPEIVLEDDQGETQKLSSYLGVPIVIYFYPRDLTPGCSLEAQTFQKDIAIYESLGVKIFGISTDPKEKHARFKAKYGLTFPLLSDINQVAANAYDVIRDKNMYGKTVRGVLRSTFVIDEKGRLIFVEYGSKPLLASEHVLKALKAR